MPSLCIELAVRGEELPDCFQLAFRQGLVERVLIDRLGEKLGEMAAHIVDHAPLRLDAAAEVPAGIAIDVDERLQLHPEAARVREAHPVRWWKTSWPSIEIESRGEAGMLILAALLNDPVAVANRPG